MPATPTAKDPISATLVRLDQWPLGLETKHFQFAVTDERGILFLADRDCVIDAGMYRASALQGDYLNLVIAKVANGTTDLTDNTPIMEGAAIDSASIEPATAYDLVPLENTIGTHFQSTGRAYVVLAGEVVIWEIDDYADASVDDGLIDLTLRVRDLGTNLRI